MCVKILKIPQISTSVSYTHLDVYKRQNEESDINRDLDVMGHVLDNNDVKNVRSLTVLGELSRTFETGDMSVPVVTDELAEGVAIGVGNSTVPEQVSGIEVADYLNSVEWMVKESVPLLGRRRPPVRSGSGPKKQGDIPIRQVPTSPRSFR